jgi:hypothetical protein
VKSSIVATQEVRIGEPTVVDAPSPQGTFSVVFEDDGDTGYFYALDLRLDENPIVDAVQVYNVASVADRYRPSNVQVVWAGDGRKAMLLINRYPHAIFDFLARRGYCRTGCPPPMPTGWTDQPHAWRDEAVELFL